MWTSLLLASLFSGFCYTATMMFFYIKKLGAAERELEITKAQLEAERKAVADALEAERVTRASFDDGRLYEDDGYRRD